MYDQSDLTPSVSESTPKRNDSELSDKNGDRKSGLSRVCVRPDWLIAVCYSNIGDALMLFAGSLGTKIAQPGFGPVYHHHHHHHLSLNREGRWGTTDDFATSFLQFSLFSHFSLFSTALWDLPNSRPVHSLMLSS